MSGLAESAAAALLSIFRRCGFLTKDLAAVLVVAFVDEAVVVAAEGDALTAVDTIIGIKLNRVLKSDHSNFGVPGLE